MVITMTFHIDLTKATTAEIRQLRKQLTELGVCIAHTRELEQELKLINRKYKSRITEKTAYYEALCLLMIADALAA
jgi:hypothetical protein